jgi:hypothetical protein
MKHRKAFRLSKITDVLQPNSGGYAQNIEILSWHSPRQPE